MFNKDLIDLILCLYVLSGIFNKYLIDLILCLYEYDHHHMYDEYVDEYDK